MADPTWLPDALDAEGVDVAEYPDWRHRGHGDFGGIWGVVAHHTGNPPGANNPGYIANHPTLGLCSQIHLARNGIATIVGAGIAWHAGNGSWPGIQKDNANQVTIGIEAENNGTEGWGPDQYWAYVRICAAICRKLGHGADRVIAHKEWAGKAQGKWDPGGMNMDKFRADIQVQINTGFRPTVRNEIDYVASFSDWLGGREFPGERPCKDGVGRYAEFESGSIYWHPSIGALPVPMHLFEEWAARQWEQGPLGYPTRFHVVYDGQGDIQEFQGGVLARRYGADGFVCHGVIGARWMAENGVRGALGWPTSDEYDTPDGGRRQDFEHDSLVWHPSGAIKIVGGN